MKKKLIMSLAVMLLLASAVFAQSGDSSTKFSEYDEAVGRVLAFEAQMNEDIYHYGIGGTGLTYQRWIGPWGYSVSAGGFYDSEYGEFAYSGGIEVMRQLYAADFGNWFSSALYILTGLGTQGYQELVYSEPDYTLTDFSWGLTTGLGVGVELLLFRHFSAPVQFGYIIQPGFGGEDPFTMNLFVEMGFRYRY